MTIYTRGQFIDFCYRVFGEYKLSNGGSNINLLCPFCASNKGIGYNKKKFVIHTETHVLHCWVCGFKSSNLLPILRKYHPNHLDQYTEKFYKNEVLVVKDESQPEEKTVEFPEGFTLLATSDRRDPYINKALQYLEKRNIADEDLWFWKLGVSVREQELVNRIVAPTFNKEGEFVFYSARDFVGNLKKKYCNPTNGRENIVFNEINIDWNEELIITEGIFDMFKCPENSTCLLGSDLSANYRLFQENRTPVVLALDPDAFKKTLMLAGRLFEFDVPVKLFEVPDPFSDVGEMTKQQFINNLENAIVFDVDYSLRRKILNII
jgi:hypothetical protein